LLNTPVRKPFYFIFLQILLIYLLEQVVSNSQNKTDEREREREGERERERERKRERERISKLNTKLGRIIIFKISFIEVLCLFLKSLLYLEKLENQPEIFRFLFGLEN